MTNKAAVPLELLGNATSAGRPGKVAIEGRTLNHEQHAP